MISLLLPLLAALSPLTHAAPVPAPVAPRVVSVQAGGPPAQSCSEAQGLETPRPARPTSPRPPTWTPCRR
jgi:hypothetical protein